MNIQKMLTLKGYNYSIINYL